MEANGAETKYLGTNMMSDCTKEIAGLVRDCAHVIGGLRVIGAARGMIGTVLEVNARADVTAGK